MNQHETSEFAKRLEEISTGLLAAVDLYECDDWTKPKIESALRTVRSDLADFMSDFSGALGPR